MKCFVIPLNTGATGVVSKGLKKKSGNYTRSSCNRFFTKTATLATSNKHKSET